MSDYQLHEPNPDNEVDLRVGDKLRVHGYDVVVKAVHAVLATVEHKNLGEFTVPIRQPADLVNSHGASRDDLSDHGPVADRVHSRCHICGADYPNHTLEKAKAKHRREQRCNGTPGTFA